MGLVLELVLVARRPLQLSVSSFWQLATELTLLALPHSCTISWIGLLPVAIALDSWLLLSLVD